MRGRKQMYNYKPITSPGKIKPASPTLAKREPVYAFESALAAKYDLSCARACTGQINMFN